MGERGDEGESEGEKEGEEVGEGGWVEEGKGESIPVH